MNHRGCVGYMLIGSAACGVNYTVNHFYLGLNNLYNLPFLYKSQSFKHTSFSVSTNYCSVIVGIIQEIINFNKHQK